MLGKNMLGKAEEFLNKRTITFFLGFGHESALNKCFKNMFSKM